MGGKVLKTLIKTLKDPHTSNSDSLPFDYWRGFFESAGTDIFDLIDHAILIAIEDYPSDFSSRRDKIIETCFADQPNKIIEGSKIVEKVISIKDSLAKSEEKPESFLFESLKKLQKMELSVEILKATKIVKTVKHLQKHPSNRIRHLSKLLIYIWKLLKDESAGTSQYSVENCKNVWSVRDAQSSLEIPPISPSLRLPLLVSEEEELLKKSDDLTFETKLENSRRRLRDAYEEERNAKKQRCLKLIDLKDLPNQGKLQEQRKPKSSCCPKKL